MSGSANTHARIGSPSDSPRWINCTLATSYEHMFRLGNSPTRNSGQEAEYRTFLKFFKITDAEVQARGFEEDDSSEWANEGTDAHDWGESILLGDVDMDEIPEVLQGPVGVYVDECERLQEDGELEPYIEAKVPLWYNPEITGTMDFAVASEDLVSVRDYKHGAGIFVEVENNTQLAIYALSFMLDLEDQGHYSFNPDTVVEIGIVQPRHHAGEPVRIWEIAYRDLQLFSEHIEDAYHRNNLEDGVFAPGEKTCQWCKLKAHCDARRDWLTKDVPASQGKKPADFFSEMPTFKERGSSQKFAKAYPTVEERLDVYHEAVEPVSLLQLVEIARRGKGIMAWLQDVNDLISQRVLAGEEIEGTKIVMGSRGNRAYIDEAKADKMLENQKIPKADRTVSKLISITKAEELVADKLKKKKGRKDNPLYAPRFAKSWEANIGRKAAVRVMAFDDDPREAVTSTMDDMPEVDGDLE